MFDPTPLLVWSFAGFATRAIILSIAPGSTGSWVNLTGCGAGFHPVVVFGRAISFADDRWNSRIGVNGRSRMSRWPCHRAVDLAAAFVGLLLTFGGPIVALAVLTILLAARSLDDHIRAVARALHDGIEPARLAVGMIVGRDTSTMNEGDICPRRNRNWGRKPF